MASDFQRQFEDAVRDSEIDGAKGHAGLSRAGVRRELRGTVDKPLMIAYALGARAGNRAGTMRLRPEHTPKEKAKPRAKKPKTALKPVEGCFAQGCIAQEAARQEG